MDRRVKERLVGASILVVLIVLIVPELLSGPASMPAAAPPAAAPPAAVPPAAVPSPAAPSPAAPLHNVTVDLRTSRPPVEEPVDAASASSAQPSGPRDEAASAAVHQATVLPPALPSAAPVTSPSPTTASTPPRAVARPPVAPSPPLESTATPPTSWSTAAKSAAAGRDWAVQLGSFASHDNADKLLRQLKTQGFAAYMLSGGSGTSRRYRVRIGPMADHNSAAQAIAKLKGLGHAASIVPPGP